MAIREYNLSRSNKTHIFLTIDRRVIKMPKLTPKYYSLTVAKKGYVVKAESSTKLKQFILEKLSPHYKYSILNVDEVIDHIRGDGVVEDLVTKEDTDEDAKSQGK